MRLSGSGIEAAAGEDALQEAAERPADWVMGAIAGSIGLRPTLAAIERGATVALANKECLVCAGDSSCAAPRRPARPCCRSNSEHNAIFQALGAGHRDDVRRVILTASGGPFRTWTREAIRRDTGTGLAPSKLVDGAEGHHRLRDHDEQRPGS